MAPKGWGGSVHAPWLEEHLDIDGALKPPRYEMPTDEPFRLYVKDVARIAGVSPISVRKWADAGLIPHIRLPSGWRKFRMSDAYKLGGHKLATSYVYSNLEEKDHHDDHRDPTRD